MLENPPYFRKELSRVPVMHRLTMKTLKGTGYPRS
ncbi:hypothetical protein O9993_05785 [Vibrio lentus]|nr:hypothetical protein [Vibrio lentus]